LVTNFKRDGNRLKSIQVEIQGETKEITAEHFISSVPMTALMQKLNPSAPPAVIEASKNLSYRDFIIVALIIDEEYLFPDNWIYIHSPEVKVGRIQNFKNWSPALVPDLSKTCLGMEYFATEGDSLWSLSDPELIKLATKEIEQLGLAKATKIEDATVIRQKKAYPVYDRDYQRHLEVIRDYLQTFDNLQSVGRNGMHRYNNQDHSMLTGLLAARNILGEKNNLWQVNTERSYYEKFTQEEWQKKKILAKT
jgi:protoporphyrinogen oxidase